jgi:hypothetical protein
MGLVKNMRTGTVYMQDHKDFLPVYRAKGTGLKVVCISNFPKAAEVGNPELYVPSVRHRCKLVNKYDERKRQNERQAKIRRQEKDEEDMAILKNVMPQEMPDLPILVAAVGTKEEQHSPSPEPERRKAKESTARFPRVYVASIGLEIAGKCKDPPTEFQQQLNEISKWEWSEIPEHHNALIRRVLEDNPRLIGSTKVIVIDAKHQVPDPGRNKALQGHTGYHPETMKHTAVHLHDDQYQYLADEMVAWTKSFEGEDRPEEGTDLIVISKGVDRTDVVFTRKGVADRSAANTR